MRPRIGAEVGLAALIATLGWVTLAIDGLKGIHGMLADGTGLGEAIYLYCRYFTILTNFGVTALMTVTVLRTYRGYPLPAARFYAAALVYIIVVSVTYEALLRAEWSPRGLQFFTDMTFHDIIPALTVLYWFPYAPKAGLRWRDPAWFLVYPTVYFALTVLFGALGEGYPYDFLDAAKLGYPVVLRTALVFLAVFYAFGMAALGYARARTKPRMSLT